MTTTRITGNTTSYPELDALQKEFKRIYGPSFKDLPNRENTLLIFVQQGFENVAVQMDYILSLGIDKEHIFMTTKPQTTHEEMRQIFQFQVGYYERFAWKDVNIALSNSDEDIAIDRTRSHYGQRAEVTCERLLERVGSFLNHNHGQKIQNILVMDEGGRFLSLFAEKYQEWQTDDRHFNIVSLEHTMSGTTEFDCSTLPFPCILMADCYLKTKVEAQYVADGVIEASRAVLEERVDDDTVFGVIGCGNVGSHVIELLREEYPDKKILVTDIESSVFTQIKINDLGWQDEVERVETKQEVFARAVLVFGCTGKDITEGLSRIQVAGNSQQTTLISASSGDREYLSLLINSPDYKFDSPEDFRDVSFEIEEADADSPQIIIHNGGFPVNFSPNRQYGIPLDKVGLTLGLKFAAVVQALKLFNLFQLAQQHPDPQKRVWLTRYMMLDPRLQQIILENFPLSDDQTLSKIVQGSYGDRPMTREQIVGEVVLTKLLRGFYQGKGKGMIPLMFHVMFHEIVLPIDKAFIRLRVKSHAACQEREGCWPLARLFEATDPQTPIRHIVIEGEPGVGKTTLSQFIGFACFNRNLYEQVASAEQEEGAEEYKEDRPTPIMPASPLLKEVNQWASLFKGVIIVRLRDLNGFDFDITQVDSGGNDHYSLAKYQLAEFILKLHQLDENSDIGDTLKERAETLLGWLYSTEANKKPHDHYLLVLDGYDELTGGMYQDPLIEGHAVLGELLNYPFWLLTSRPKQVDDAILAGEVCDRHLDLAGFAHEDVDAYVRAVIPLLHSQSPEEREETPASDKVDSLLEFLAQRPSLKQLARVPICCQLLCYLWNDAQARLESIEPLTPALLYKEMVILLAKRARRRQAGIDREVINSEMTRHEVVAIYYQAAFSALAELSFAKQTGSQTHQLVVSENDLNRLPGIDGVRRTIATDLHLLNPTHRVETQQQGYTTDQPEQYEFTHLSFQEFLAAIHLVRQLASDDAEARQAAKTFVIEHKYEQHHRNMLGYASSIIMEADCNLLWGGDEHYRNRAKMAFWEGIREENAAQAIQGNDPQYIALLIDLWVKMGDKLDQLPVRDNGARDYDGLEERLIGIIERNFNKEVVSYAERQLINVLNRVPGGQLGSYFPRINDLCQQKINENFKNLASCTKFIAVFCVNGKLMPVYGERLLELLRLESEEDRKVCGATWHAFSQLGAALSALGQCGPDVVSVNRAMRDALIAGLSATDGQVRWVAWLSLGQLGADFVSRNEDVRDALILGLRATNMFVCRAGWVVLGQWGADFVSANQDVRQALIACLAATCRMKRRFAWCALYQWGAGFVSANSDVRQALITLLNHTNCFVRGPAWGALGHWGAAFVRENDEERYALIAGLHAAEWDVRRNALSTLGQLGSAFILVNQEMRDALIAGLSAIDAKVRRASLSALGQLGADFVSANEEMRFALVAGLSDADEDACWDAWGALGQLGPDFISANQEMQDAWIAGLGAGNEFVRRAALYALGQLGSDFVTANQNVRQALIVGLHATNDSVCENAWAALGKLGGDFVSRNEDVRDALIASLRATNDSVRRAALNALGALVLRFIEAYPQVEEAVKSCLDSDDTEVRRLAQEILDLLAAYRREQAAATELTNNPNSFHAQAPAQATRPASAAAPGSVVS